MLLVAVDVARNYLGRGKEQRIKHKVQTFSMKGNIVSEHPVVFVLFCFVLALFLFCFALFV